MESRNLFRQESLDRVSSPEKLDDYIKVSNPRIWMLIAAMFSLVIGVVIWSFTGTLPKTMTSKGFSNSNHTITCYISASDISKNIVGCSANISVPQLSGTLSGKIMNVSDIPYSKEEISDTLKSDWMIENLVNANYMYAVEVKLDDNINIQENTLTDVTIVTSEVRPIEYIFN